MDSLENAINVEVKKTEKKNKKKQIKKIDTKNSKELDSI
jgi:hypothetical protein